MRRLTLYVQPTTVSGLEFGVDVQCHAQSKPGPFFRVPFERIGHCSTCEAAVRTDEGFDSCRKLSVTIARDGSDFCAWYGEK
jgi:hypothetical protein